MQIQQLQSLMIVDCALVNIIRQRLIFFNDVSRYYAQQSNTKYIGFESLIVAELFTIFRTRFSANSVFLEYPCGPRTKVDLHVNYPQIGNSSNCQKIYSELKMYYSNCKDQYDNDFKKLKTLVDSDPECIAVQIHFQYYLNSNRPAHRLLKGYYQSLNTANSTYWKSIRRIGPRGGQQFYRLAFGKN